MPEDVPERQRKQGITVTRSFRFPKRVNLLAMILIATSVSVGTILILLFIFGRTCPHAVLVCCTRYSISQLNQLRRLARDQTRQDDDPPEDELDDQPAAQAEGFPMIRVDAPPFNQ